MLQTARTAMWRLSVLEDWLERTFLASVWYFPKSFRYSVIFVSKGQTESRLITKDHLLSLFKSPPTMSSGPIQTFFSSVWSWGVAWSEEPCSGIPENGVYGEWWTWETWAPDWFHNWQIPLEAVLGNDPLQYSFISPSGFHFPVPILPVGLLFC